MALKDTIKRDIDTVFMNPNDYCDNLVIPVGIFAGRVEWSAGNARLHNEIRTAQQPTR